MGDCGPCVERRGDGPAVKDVEFLPLEMASRSYVYDGATISMGMERKDRTRIGTDGEWK